MGQMYAIAVEGLASLKDFEAMGGSIRTAARQAINTTLTRGRTASARRIRQQINFPASYLSASSGRLDVSRKASNGNLEGAITGRQRPTSLARFLVGTQSRGVRVAVHPGQSKRLPRAFLVKLRSGSEALGNLGLAIRTKGERPRSAYKPKRLGKNLWLLYGPSVDQVFRTVAEDVSPELGDFLEKEFLRLVDLRR